MYGNICEVKMYPVAPKKEGKNSRYQPNMVISRMCTRLHNRQHIYS